MTGLIILCRYNSTRLPGKILKEINGKTILKYIYERLSKINCPSGNCGGTNPYII